jgi:hypothetical protein
MIASRNEQAGEFASGSSAVVVTVIVAALAETAAANNHNATPINPIKTRRIKIRPKTRRERKSHDRRAQAASAN